MGTNILSVKQQLLAESDAISWQHTDGNQRLTHLSVKALPSDYTQQGDYARF